MDQIVFFIYTHELFSLIMTLLNIILIRELNIKISLQINKNLYEAMGGRNSSKTPYKRCINAVRKSFSKFEASKSRTGFYKKAALKVKKSGYSGEHAAVIYIILKFLAPAAVFIFAFIINFPSVIQAIAMAVLVFSSVEYILHRKKRRIELKFNRYIYKIYKYLHNQISSGIKPTDAIKTVYLIVDDKELRDILIRLAASYELTLNIDQALMEFQSNFDIQEAETLCTALKQGVETGDNQNLLSRQEQFMFNRYFNYIQAETDNCKLKGTISVFMFGAIAVIMIAVPLFNDVIEATTKIFVN